MKYREFELNDYHAAIVLWKQTEGVGISAGDSYEGISNYLTRNPGLSFVAEHEGKLVGTLLSGHDGRRGYLYHLAIHPKFRREGLGTKLITLALSALKNEGIEKSHIHVFVDNTEGKQYWLNRDWHERTDLIVCSFINSNEENA